MLKGWEALKHVVRRKVGGDMTRKSFVGAINVKHFMHADELRRYAAAPRDGLTCSSDQYLKTGTNLW